MPSHRSSFDRLSSARETAIPDTKNYNPAPTDPKEPGTRSTGPFCFKWEQRHRLEDCSQFKELVVADRATFCHRHGLYFASLGGGHDEKLSTEAALRFQNCKSYDHRLLHDGRPPEPRTAPPSMSAIGIILIKVAP